MRPKSGYGFLEVLADSFPTGTGRRPGNGPGPAKTEANPDGLATPEEPDGNIDGYDSQA
jgi:hypothetical protein